MNRPETNGISLSAVSASDVAAALPGTDHQEQGQSLACAGLQCARCVFSLVLGTNYCRPRHPPPPCPPLPPHQNISGEWGFIVSN